MPRRFAEGTAKVISWEDLYYLYEWIEECRVILHNNTMVARVGSNRVVQISDYLDGLEYVDSPNNAIPIKLLKGSRIRGLLSLLYYSANLEEWLLLADYGMKIIPYVFFKESSFNPITQVTKFESTSDSNVELYFAGFASLSSLSTAEGIWNEIENKIIDIWTADGYGEKVIGHCLDNNNQPLQAGTSLDHNIILSMYYILLKLKNSIVIKTSSNITGTSIEKVWDARTWRYTTQFPSYNQSTGERIQWEYETRSSGLDSNGEIIITSSTTTRTNELASVSKHYYRSAFWSETLWNKIDDNEREYLHYLSTKDENIQGWYYSNNGNNIGNGSYSQSNTKELIIPIPYDVKYHTADGNSNDNNDYLHFLKFWFYITISVRYWRKIEDNITTEIVAPGGYDVVIPFSLDNSKFIGVKDSDSSRYMLLTITSSGIEDLIRNSLNAIKSGLYNTWVSDAKSIPTSMEDNLAPAIDISGDSYVDNDINSAENHSSQYDIWIDIDLNQVSVALKWSSKLAVGLPEIQDAFWDRLT